MMIAYYAAINLATRREHHQYFTASLVKARMKLSIKITTPIGRRTILVEIFQAHAPKPSILLKFQKYKVKCC